MDFFHTPVINDYGSVGLMQMPSARFSPDGELVAGLSSVTPYNRYFATVQLLPWLESTIRYTEVTNRLYGPIHFSGDQTYKDRGIDLKIKLRDETKYAPQLALGIRDLGGTAFFASEFLVASKRYYDWDFTLGLGWGKLGTRGQIENPLGLISHSFETRGGTGGFGGTAVVSDWFSGERTSIFGGIEYHTPIKGLSFKIEYDGNNYQREPLQNYLEVDSPINFGVTYRPWNWLDLSVGLERGNTLMTQAVIRMNMHKEKGLPKFDRAPQGLRRRSEISEEAAEKVAARVFEQMSGRGFEATDMRLSENRATVSFSQDNFRELPRAFGRVARIVADNVPPKVEEIELINLEGGVEATRLTLMRHDLENAVAYRGSPEEIWAHTRFHELPPDGPAESFENPDRYPKFDWSVSPKLRQHIGGPDNFYLWQLWALVSGELEVARGLSLDAGLGFDLYNNFDQLRLESNSVLPHVRSDIKHYLQEGANGIYRLQLDYLFNPFDDWYGRLSGGIFEQMYGGVGGEILYRPFGRRWAIGADLNWVQQRGYDQRFSFLDYSIVTGHGNFYYDIPYANLHSAISVGQYLAGDVGVTIDLNRRFDTGMRIGAYATFTNVSAAEFGEGSFDKGFYISMPLDLFFVKSRRTISSFSWSPLTRDGGQRLGIGKRLYDVTQSRSFVEMSREWHRFLE